MSEHQDQSWLSCFWVLWGVYVKCSVECCVNILGFVGVQVMLGFVSVQGTFHGFIWSFNAVKVDVLKVFF